MQIPRMFLGLQGEVSKRTAPLLKAFSSGADLDGLDFGPMVTTIDFPDVRLLLNPGRMAASHPSFHCYALLYGVMQAMTKRKLERSRFDVAFGWSLQRPWSFVGTLGEAGTAFFLKMSRDAFTREPPPEILRGRPEWYAPFLRAALAHWTELTNEGPRFGTDAFTPAKAFPRNAFALKSVLGDCGVAKVAADIDTPEKVLKCIHRALLQLEQ